MSALRKTILNVEEYLAAEALADIRHEYIAGNIYAMAGATERHNRIAGNLFFQLRNVARGSNCGVFMSDMKLRTKIKNTADTCFYYPDVMLGCDTSDDHPNYKTQPCLIAEVLSPSTETIDRREKLLAYKNIPSLKYYLLVSSIQTQVEYYEKNEQGQWLKAVLEAHEFINVHCGHYHASLCLEDIYEDVRW
ncbi:Uncharacterised protein [Candidatus Venteria ishoeyi]|uniref:Putative restriction endonuclease domain-containing protein n=2 Tax=Candidatus Venteria ishoeyi TaxID=1899563 RepID=A0A1H6F7V2_9GAMM|nr:Uncharacterised protein [Candidatus Venteria ishoeyi]